MRKKRRLRRTEEEEDEEEDGDKEKRTYRRNCNLYTRGLRRSEVEEEKGRRKRG